MWSKAPPRFKEKAPDDLPGPGAYDPKIYNPLDQPYKKGANLDASRYHEDKGPEYDNFGAYDPFKEPQSVKKVKQAIWNPEKERDRHKKEMEVLKERLQKAHTKETLNMKNKLNRVECQLEELTKERDALKSVQQESRQTKLLSSQLSSNLEELQLSLSPLYSYFSLPTSSSPSEILSSVRLMHSRSSNIQQSAFKFIKSLRDENSHLTQTIEEQRQSLSTLKRALQAKEEVLLEVVGLMEDMEEEKDAIRSMLDSTLEDMSVILEDRVRREKDAAKELKQREKLLKKMSELRNEHVHIEEEREFAKELLAVEVGKVEVESLENLLEAEAKIGVLENELEDEKRKVEEAKQQKKVDGEIKKAMEKLVGEKRTLITALSQSRARESGLQNDLDEAYGYLSNLSNLQHSHNQLFEEYESLKSLTVSIHAENQTLKNENMQLVNHGNPAQKIQAMSRLREEMKSLRETNAKLDAKLKRGEKEKEQLVEELEAYGSVGCINRPIIHIAKHDITLERVLNDKPVNTLTELPSPTPSEKVWQSMNLSPDFGTDFAVSKVGAAAQSTPAKFQEAPKRSMIPRRRLERIAESKETVLSDEDMKAMEHSLDQDQRMLEDLENTPIRRTGMMTLDEFY